MSKPLRQPASRTLACLLSGVVGFVSAGCEGTPADGAPHAERSRVAVETVVVEASAIPVLLSAVGAFESPQSTMVSSEVSGIVTFLDVPEGAEVERGRVLARVDSRQADAQLTVALARYNSAKDTLERVRVLFRDGLVSRQELDDASYAYDQAAGVLEESRTSVNQTEIAAPFSGQLGLREVSLGAFVNAGEPIVRLTQTDPLRLIFSLPERDAGRVTIGQKVHGIAGDCTARFETEVQIVDPTVDPKSRSIRAQATVNNPDRLLRAGMSARLTLEVGRLDAALTVPYEAVVRRGTVQFVYVVLPDERIEEREVTLGQNLLDRVEVRSGLAAGETVVAGGQQRIRADSLADARPYRPVANPKLALGAPVAEQCEL